MIIIAKNAEKELLVQLNDYIIKNPVMRCLYIRFSAIEIDFETWFPRFAYEFSKFFDDETLVLYVCHDRDVFITARMMTHRTWHQFLTHLNLKLQPALPSELANLFEIGVDWARLKQLCKTKLQSAFIQQKATVAEKKEVVQSVSREQTIKELDRDLLSSLSMRRSMRAHLSIMAVEDDIFSQKLIKSALSAYDLAVSTDGQGAVMSYVAKAPDVLFLDIGLPDMDGHEVLEKIFKLDPEAYVVMFSGNGSKDNIMKALQQGAKGFVGKPFTKDKLISYIDSSPHIIAKKKKG